MNERAFTPGPWFVSEPNDPQRTGLLIKPIPGDVVAEIDVLSNAIANARLIAAAPELYEALSKALPYIREEGSKYQDDGANEPLELARDIEELLAKVAP